MGQHTQINNRHHVQKLRDRNPMIMSTHAEKASVKKKILHGKSSENTRKLSVSVIFPLLVIKYPDKKQLKKKRIYFILVSSQQKYPGDRSLQSLMTLCAQSGSREL